MIIAIGIILVFLFLMVITPKVTTGRILYAENFVPEFQVYRPLARKDLSTVPVTIEIVHRKLYRIRVFALLKSVLELLPGRYSVNPSKNGLFFFWAYPFDIVHIIVGEDRHRVTHTLSHRVNDFWPGYANFLLALSSLFSPKLLHGECIEIPMTFGTTCGYAGNMGASPGEEIDLMISSGAETVSFELVRVGKSLHKADEVGNIPGKYQKVETPFPSALGCGWKPVYRYRLPDDLSSGCYILRLEDNRGQNGSFIPLIVKPLNPVNEVAVIASTNTWHAYNSWGGQNYYINHTTFPSKYAVSSKRPFDLYLRDVIGDACEVARDHLLAGERFVWSWLERERIGYDLYSDEDLHSRDVFESLLMKYKVIMISTHNEYWSFEMIKHLQKFIGSGGNVVSLSGNAVYKEVTYLDGGLIVLDGALLRHQNQPEEAVLGVAYNEKGFATWAPYKVMNPEHWVFEGTGLKKGDLFGEKGLNVAPDGGQGASAWETDKMQSLTPPETVLLAKGTNPNFGGAEMVLLETAEGGSIFSVGSITFGGSLLVDEHISRITRNVIDNFLTREKA